MWLGLTLALLIGLNGVSAQHGITHCEGSFLQLKKYNFIIIILIYRFEILNFNDLKK